MYKIVCKICEKEFKVFLSRKYTAKFCSMKCLGKSKIGKPAWNKGLKRWWTSSTEFKKGIIPHNKGIKTGKRAPNFIGRIYNEGYIRVFKINHPNTSKHNYVYEHRLVAEKVLGRYLTKEERIHHINRVKDDNRPENLYYFENEREHQLYEQSKNQPKLKSNLSEMSSSTLKEL